VLMLTTGYRILDLTILLFLVYQIKTRCCRKFGDVKAAIYDKTAPAGIRIRDDCPMPKIANGQLIVKVMAAGVNPVDAKFCWGDKLPQYEIFDGLAQRGVDGNVVGFDYAGVVVEAGTGSKFKKGDEVFGILPPMRGSYA